MPADRDVSAARGKVNFHNRLLREVVHATVTMRFDEQLDPLSGHPSSTPGRRPNRRRLFLCVDLGGCRPSAYPAPMSQPDSAPPQRQRAINLPGVIIWLLVVLAGIHAIRVLLLSNLQADWVILNFAFFPSRPEAFLAVREVPGAAVWSFVTYGLLHADWGHLLLNALWMAAFGSPLAWRFGAVRFLAFSAVAVVAGALVHLVAHGGEQIPLIGASAAVSAHLAGVARFLFVAPRGGMRSVHGPAASLQEMFSDPRTLLFLGVWIAINLAVGLFGLFSDAANAIAWEAHVGGFAVGLFLFPFFDPERRRYDSTGD